eukprot:4494332-Alexandrium_andersonii.AAC.1
MSRAAPSTRFTIWACSTQVSSGGGADQPLRLFQTRLPRMETAENSTRRTHLGGMYPSAKMYPFRVATKSAFPRN